jgi:hypothetical protein
MCLQNQASSSARRKALLLVLPAAELWCAQQLTRTSAHQVGVSEQQSVFTKAFSCSMPVLTLLYTLHVHTTAVALLAL